MITIGYSTRYSKPIFKEYLQKTCMYKEVEIIEKVNNGEKSLSQVYNEILEESSNDIVVLCHDDIEFDTVRWGDKILKIFEKFPDYGIVGLAGSTMMPESGMWWEDRTKMYGIVNHKHEGKKWESKYAPHLGNVLKNSVVVDGLFIAINKNNIVENFDEDCEGFHMYDVNFCISNFLKNVKIGITTDVRVTHLSIGMTNNSWQENRIKFIEKYKNDLPLKVKYNNEDKLNVLITCLFFQNYTGSEMYVYELAKNLKSLNCDVTILARETNGPLVKKIKQFGVNVKNFIDPPGYKLGDGKWGLNTPQGFQVSKPNQYYKTDEVHFDIIHCQHTPIVELTNMLYPTIDKISTIHSEVISLENPVKHPSIKKYIAIRPEIKEHIVKNFGIEEDKVEIIYNPIDFDRFNTKNVKDLNYVLFVGTIDYLRKQTIYDLVEYTKSVGKELWLVGKNNSDYLEDLKKNNHVKYYDSTYNVESFVKNCSETAGILLGRTTIEGWLCGKNGWIYNVDNSGVILNKEKHKTFSDMSRFDSKNVSSVIKKQFLSILNNEITNKVSN